MSKNHSEKNSASTLASSKYVYYHYWTEKTEDHYYGLIRTELTNTEYRILTHDNILIIVIILDSCSFQFFNDVRIGTSQQIP